MKNKIKYLKNAEVWINVIVEKYRDELNRPHIKTAWQRLDAPISLGSVNKPQNKEIIGFRIVNTNKEPLNMNGFGSFIGRMFGEE